MHHPCRAMNQWRVCADYGRDGPDGSQLEFKPQEYKMQIHYIFIVGVFLASSLAVSSEETKKESRFSVSERKKFVTDNESGLIWQRVTNNNGYNWEEAFDFCKKFSLPEYKAEWRLPVLKELQSLVVEPPKPSLLYIEQNAFPSTQSEFFWTASANDEAVAAIFFDMSKFPTGLGKDRSLGHVRCVTGSMNSTYQINKKASYNLMTIPRALAK